MVGIKVTFEHALRHQDQIEPSGEITTAVVTTILVKTFRNTTAIILQRSTTTNTYKAIDVLTTYNHYALGTSAITKLKVAGNPKRTSIFVKGTINNCNDQLLLIDTEAVATRFRIKAY